MLAICCFRASLNFFLSSSLALLSAIFSSSFLRALASASARAAASASLPEVNDTITQQCSVNQSFYGHSIEYTRL
jgi:hypothetical protein